MKRFIRELGVCVLATALLGGGGSASACTTFCLSAGGHVVFGRNYDFEIGDGLVVVNKRGVSKMSIITRTQEAGDHGAQVRARWTSKFGSVTFNQFGRAFPTGGLNEKGLVVELMWLDGTKYPPPDARPAVTILEWIQYQLDEFGSVAELIGHLGTPRIRGQVPLHYLVADRSGDAATIEFLDGRPHVHRGEALPVMVLTNSTYESSLASLARYKEFGGDRPLPNGPGSLERFARAASMLKSPSFGAGNAVDRAFSILANVAQGDHTRWSIVYDTTSLEVWFRTWNNPEIRRVRLAAFDLLCSSPVRTLDVTARLSGSVEDRFVDYTTSADLDLLTRSYAGVSFLAGTPSSVIERMAQHPESEACGR